MPHRAHRRHTPFVAGYLLVEIRADPAVAPTMPCTSPRCPRAANAGCAGDDEDSIRFPLITWAAAINHGSIGDQSSLRIARERLLAPVPVIVGFQAGLGRTGTRV